MLNKIHSFENIEVKNDNNNFIFFESDGVYKMSLSLNFNFISLNKKYEINDKFKINIFINTYGDVYYQFKDNFLDDLRYYTGGPLFLKRKIKQIKKAINDYLKTKESLFDFIKNVENNIILESGKEIKLIKNENSLEDYYDAELYKDDFKIKFNLVNLKEKNRVYCESIHVEHEGYRIVYYSYDFKNSELYKKIGIEKIRESKEIRFKELLKIKY